jgi:hypothetical protein
METKHIKTLIKKKNNENVKKYIIGDKGYC